MTRRNRILVPGARKGLDELKHKIIREANEPYRAEQAEDLGNKTSRENGKTGGSIGGSMVREMVRMAEENLKHR
ncbi:Small, acid-soluble spore protein, alpha/beta type [Terribacillus aidingensis]|uniref:Small, acid-soluble spore protein, alpha/beta type n=1 Tax=Terribacillus aidingensis TaxID=586416 RepID=A0A285N808_9BACI|nr:alpha/beta-type small acid-soluble spore protein [Terribacillus aidingensis]SNZ05605.1 Small, acid-soluble spore protein, alpha/beta type [Terribacillus aidingensis]